MYIVKDAVRRRHRRVGDGKILLGRTIGGWFWGGRSAGHSDADLAGRDSHRVRVSGPCELPALHLDQLGENSRAVCWLSQVLPLRLPMQWGAASGATGTVMDLLGPSTARSGAGWRCLYSRPLSRLGSSR